MKLDSQPGAVLAAEIKNNGCKLAKWTVSSILSGADLMKFGFVSRVNARATDKHVILGMQQFKPNELSSQIALNMDNAWGVIRCIIDYWVSAHIKSYKLELIQMFNRITRKIFIFEIYWRNINFR